MAPNSEEARFGAGDVMGCGTILVPSKDSKGSSRYNRAVFFTKNGSFLGVAFIVEDPQRDLYPCAGIDAHWTVRFNFGARPYAFDVDSLGQAMVPHAETAIPTSVSAADCFAAASGEGATLGKTKRSATATLAALQLIQRAAKSFAWMRRRGRDLVYPFSPQTS
jgi:hypothetical protein